MSTTTQPTQESTVDVIAALAGVRPGSELAALRAQRAAATEHAQRSYQALFAPADAGDLTLVERYAAAARAAELHADDALAAHYRSGGTDVRDQVRAAAIGAHVELLTTRPASARPDHLRALAAAGLSTSAIVSLSQLVAFVSFQTRVITGLRLLGAHPAGTAPLPVDRQAPAASPEPLARGGAEVSFPGPDLVRPLGFTRDGLEWTPWLTPLDLAEATDEQRDALAGWRANSPYFRLLAWDSAVLVERTATDNGIFYTHGGLPRAERELAATATSRHNGCVYCASVHARLAAQLSDRAEDIDRLLDRGAEPGSGLGLDPRWQAVVDFAVALASTPARATDDHVRALREVGLAELEILDVAQASAFFSWANRLMLSLGEPYRPNGTATG
ncbi:alkylhydroperoxidase domain protein [Goodfellowiella coeruleoviolacea]|uniref:Alkylhydroperoxidase domain protein, Avi_7169 family n=1 Tax=Goodfellowiella coeruleoviolacea TaxID=334858 RepID=A0AAE3GHF8_9PSEU|nr:alkylhydroperoxidase domain protein [Goodfellowiella coeruleoviolacea]MCP2167354.1 alkylhydroperoxidase domain protein, Avi_7169 family [Goodfellowiella coeruleoviolacea]